MTMIVKTKMPIVVNNNGNRSSFDGDSFSYIDDQQLDSILNKGVAVADSIAQIKAAGKAPATPATAMATPPSGMGGKDGKSGGNTTTYAIVAVLVVLVGGGIYLAMKNKKK